MINEANLQNNDYIYSAVYCVGVHEIMLRMAHVVVCCA